MKKKPKYDCKYIKSIFAIFAASSIIAFFAISLQNNDTSAYAASNASTASGLDWIINNNPHIHFSDNITIDANISDAIKGDYSCKIDGTDHPELNKEGRKYSSADVTGNVSNTKYTPKSIVFNGVTYTSASFSKTSLDGDITSQPGKQQALVSFDLSELTINSDKYGNVIKSVTPEPITIGIEESKTLSNVEERRPNFSDAVVNLGGTSTDTPWETVIINNKVSWDNAPTGYKEKPTKAYTFTWKGTIPANKYIENENNIKAYAQDPVTVIATFIVTDDDYESKIDKYSSDKLFENLEPESGDFKLTSSDFEKEDFVREVLKYRLKHGSDSEISDIQSGLDNNATFTLTLKAKGTDPDDDAKKRMKKKVESDKSNAEICDYFDLTLKLKISNPKKEYTISNIGSDNSISIKIKVPEDSRKSSRKYNVVRDHDDEAKVLNSSYSSLDDDRVSFKTHLFSDYGISYYNSSSSSSKSSSSSSSRSSSVAGARTTTTGGTSSGNAAGGSRTGSGAPKTGDEFNAKLWIYFLVVGVVVALCAFILYQDTKDWRDEKKEAK